MDFTYTNHGSIVTLTPLTPQAHEWVAEHLPDDALTFGPAICIEPRYFDDIAEGILSDGLTLE